VSRAANHTLRIWVFKLDSSGTVAFAIGIGPHFQICGKTKRRRKRRQPPLHMVYTRPNPVRNGFPDQTEMFLFCFFAWATPFPHGRGLHVFDYCGLVCADDLGGVLPRRRQVQDSEQR
jgi:hypothetical protein